MRYTSGREVRGEGFRPDVWPDVWPQTEVPSSMMPTNIGTKMIPRKMASRRILAQPITVVARSSASTSARVRVFPGITCDKLNSPMVPTFRRSLLILTALTALHAAAQTPAKPALNVVIITIDTLRADHLGCYGYKQIRTPNIDALASESTRFERAYTPVPVTLPAHTVIFTGTYPVFSGMHDFSGNKLNPKQPTLASVLEGQGYTTGAVIGSAVLD